MKCLLLSFFISFITVTNSVACNSVDLSPKFGPPRDQDGMGWCAAFAFSDLLSFHLGIRVSAQDLSISSFEQEGVDLRDWKKRKIAEYARCMRRETTKSDDSAYCKDVIKIYKSSMESLSKQMAEWEAGLIESSTTPNMSLDRIKILGGVCMEKDFPSDGFKGDTGFFWSLLGYRWRQTALQSRYKDLNNALAKNKCDEATEILNDFIPGGQTKDLTQILIKTKENLRPMAIRDRACKKRHFAKFINSFWMALFTVGDKETQVEGILKIHHALDQRKPTQIGLDIGFALPYPVPGPAGHSVLVVGRRRGKNGSCEMRIRNSWGSSCYSYAKKYRKTCTNGDFWIDQKELAPHLMGIFEMEKKI